MQKPVSKEPHHHHLDIDGKCAFCPFVWKEPAPKLTPIDSDSTSEIENILTTLFHSYDARGNQLAIDEAKAKLNQILVREKLETVEWILSQRDDRKKMTEKLKAQLESQLREGASDDK